MTYQIAIKLGSSNTSIFKQGEGIVLFEPSLIAYTGSGKERVIKAIGTKAKKMLGRTDDQTFVVSPIFEGKIADNDLAVVMLKSYLAKVMGGGLLRPKIKAVVCVPLGLTTNERKAFEKVCYMAGIQDVVLVPAVMCGALGYNLPISAPNGCCLVNIGGGSTDIAVASINTIIAGVNIGVGGDTISSAIERHFYNNFKLQVGKGVGEAVKIEIGSLYKNDISNTEICGMDLDSKLAKNVVVESNAVYDAIAPYYEKIIEAIKSVLNSCPPNVVDDIDKQGIYLFGGGSLITGCEQFFKKRLETNIIIEDHTTAIDVIGAGKLLSDAKMLKEFSEI